MPTQYSSGTKRARNIQSIANQPTCGGDKKGGLAPSSGYWFLTSNPSMIGATNSQFALKCIGNYSNGSQVAARKVRMGLA
jgi:hypothetical protein